MRKFASLILGCAAFLGASEARAEVGTDNFDPQTSFRPQEFPWESGWLPEDSALQINLQAAAYQEVAISMRGDGEYDFDAQSIAFTGEADSGTFENALGIEVTAVVGIHGILGIDTEFEVGLYNIEETATGIFTPYVLPGAPVRPITVSEAFGPNELVDEDFTVPGFGLPGNLHIDYTLNVPGNEYASVYIDLNDDANTSTPMLVGQYDEENEQLDLILPNATPGQTSTLYGTLHGTFSSEISLVFDVTVTVEIADVPFEIGPFQIVLDYPVVTDMPIEFGEESMLFDVPEEPEPPGTTGGGDDDSSSGDAGGETGDSDSDSASTTSGDPPAESGDAPADTDTEGGIPADNVPGTSTGCGCASGRSSAGLWAFALLGLAAMRRRRPRD